jgi:hypothetical protein
MFPNNWFERPTLAVVGAALLVGGLLLSRQGLLIGMAMVLWGSGLLLVAVVNHMPEDWQIGGWTVSLAVLGFACCVSLAAIL